MFVSNFLRIEGVWEKKNSRDKKYNEYINQDLAQHLKKLP